MTQTLSLFVFVDALGWELVKRHDFLATLAPTRARLETVLGYSCTCDPTILTGRLPQEHGHFSFFAYAPKRSPFTRGRMRLLSLLPEALTSRARVRSKLSQLVGRQLGFTGYFNLYAVPFQRLPDLDYTERRDLYQPGGINGGQETLFDALRAAKVPHFVSDWRRDDASNVAALSQALTQQKPRVAYLYLAGMDGVLHAEGTQSERVTQKLQWYETKLTELVAQARKHYGDVRLHVFSDHGMTDVTSTCNLMARIDSLGLVWGEDYAAVYDSTMARFWLLSERAQQAIPPALAVERQGRVLTGSELRTFGCDFPDRRYGEVLFLLNPGVLLCPSFMGARPIKGMHGYDPSDPHSAASYLSNVSVPTLPRHLTDLYGLMCAESGLRATELERAA
jgi:Type I phosphodiesterase / nucleotide pyrophosphatase